MNTLFKGLFALLVIVVIGLLVYYISLSKKIENKNQQTANQRKGAQVIVDDLKKLDSLSDMDIQSCSIDKEHNPLVQAFNTFGDMKVGVFHGLINNVAKISSTEAFIDLLSPRADQIHRFRLNNWWPGYLVLDGKPTSVDKLSRQMNTTISFTCKKGSDGKYKLNIETVSLTKKL